MVTLVRAPNPSAMTLTGTNSYLVEAGSDAVVIDPGPAIPRHVDALVNALAARHLRARAILLTHGHPDHAPAAAELAARVGAPVYAHPNSSVAHDRDLPLDGELRTGAVALEVVDAPGHTFDHVAFYAAHLGALFTGDVILGEGTVVIAPPGGSMRAYQATLQMLSDRFGGARSIYGGHGERIDDPRAKFAEYIEHRHQRERELLTALQERPQTIPELVLRIYGAQRSILWPAMARQMLAYLIALELEGRVSSRALDREMDERERAILNPPWEQIVGVEHAEMVRAELGALLHLDTLYEYRLVATTIRSQPS